MPKRMPRCAIHNGPISRNTPYVGNPSPAGMTFACAECYESNVGSIRQIRRLSRAEQNGILGSIGRGIGKGAVGAAKLTARGIKAAVPHVKRGAVAAGKLAVRGGKAAIKHGVPSAKKAAGATVRGVKAVGRETGKAVETHRQLKLMKAQTELARARGIATNPRRRIRRNPWFTGNRRIDGREEAFFSRLKPTKESHGHRYRYVTGPQKDRRTAENWARYVDPLSEQNPRRRIRRNPMYGLFSPEDMKGTVELDKYVEEGHVGPFALRRIEQNPRLRRLKRPLTDVDENEKECREWERGMDELRQEYPERNPLPGGLSLRKYERVKREFLKSDLMNDYGEAEAQRVLEEAFPEHKFWTERYGHYMTVDNVKLLPIGGWGEGEGTDFDQYVREDYWGKIIAQLERSESDPDFPWR